MTNQLMKTPEQFEEDTRVALTQQLELILPGAIVRG